MSVTGARTPDIPRSVLAHTVLERLTATYAAAADPARAASAQAYIKDTAPFLGIPTPARRALSRTVLEGLPRPAEADCTAIALRCWRLRKAIGWCLREYAKTDPEAVRAFLARERGRFAPLSVREALKNIGT